MVFISHSLHWRYIKIALQEYVIIHTIRLTGNDDIPRGWCISQWVLQRWYSSRGTEYPHGYWGYTSPLLMIFGKGTECPHGNCRLASQVLMIFLKGTEYPPRHCRYFIHSEFMS